MLLSKAADKVETNSKLLVCMSGTDSSYMKPATFIFNKYFETTLFRTVQGSGLLPKFVQLVKKIKPTHIIITNLALLKALKPSLEGSVTDNYGMKLYVSGTPLIFVPPLKQIYTVNYGKFILHRYCKKVIGGYKDFLEKDSFTYKLLEPQNIDTMYRLFEKACLVAVDIETGNSEYRIITSVAYTALVGNRTYTVVLPMRADTIEWAHGTMRRFNNLPAPKVMQNGRYDSAYFLRFNAPLRNYIFDTYHMMHCMYPEMPKDLAFISSFFLDNFIFWKDEMKDNLYEYNGKDTHNTLWVFLAQMLHMRYEATYAAKNFLIEFPMVFPCIASEQEGIAVDLDELGRLRATTQQKAEEELAKLTNLLGLPEFNPNSPKQVLQLLNTFAARHKKKFDSADKTNLQHFLELDPGIHSRIVDPLLAYRKASKAVSTYFNSEKIWNGRLYYGIDPAGTETGRTSSRGSSFWCGHNVQNIPPYAKSAYLADPGYLLFEVDKSQAESWCTGYLSRDRNLLDVLHTSPDFHCTNASLFFGIPFEQLYDVATGKKLNKEIRTIAKRTNHGANYNMGAFILWNTMGTAALLEAARLLGYPAGLDPIQIAQRLLDAFDAAYPTIRDKVSGYYSRIVKEVMDTGRLVGPTGWTRRTFSDPTKNKHALNLLTAHPSQSLSVLLVNIAWKDCFWNMQIKKYPGKIRFKAQIHDSLFGQVREDSLELIEEVEERMRVPVTIHGKEMIIPGDTGPVGKRWIDIKD